MTVQMDLYSDSLGWDRIQHCRACNPGQVEASKTVPKKCIDCGGTGWSEWAALAHAPYNQVLDNVYIGGCVWTQPHERSAEDYVVSHPAPFDVVISLYGGWRKFGPNPDGQIRAYEYPFEDSALTRESQQAAHQAANHAMDVLDNGQSVLVRCQAGLNRSGLVTGIVLTDYFGYTGQRAVGKIREARGPWALCNDEYADYLINR